MKSWFDLISIFFFLYGRWNFLWKLVTRFRKAFLKYTWTRHAKNSIFARKFSPKLAEDILLEHYRGSLETQKCDGREPELKIIQQKFTGKIIRVVVNKSISPWSVVTVYDTSQINRLKCWQANIKVLQLFPSKYRYICGLVYFFHFV